MLTVETHPALDELRQVAAEAEATVSKFSLADAIREGAGVTAQATDWLTADGSTCALAAAALSLEARGL